MQPASRGFDEEQSGEEIWWNEWCEDEANECETCEGRRLNATALNVRFRDHSIAAMTAQSVADMRRQFSHLKLVGREREIARDLIAEINSRLAFLEDVGLGYLSLDRSAPTLSGGEEQRIKIVTELARVRANSCRPTDDATLCVYVLDEPTVELHIADVEKLIRVLHRLVAAGNSVVVIEHNLDVMAEADWPIDLGPEGGDGGGRIVAQGTPEDLSARARSSHTARVFRDFLRARTTVSAIEAPQEAS